MWVGVKMSSQEDTRSFEEILMAFDVLRYWVVGRMKILTEESLIPADAECKRRARFEMEDVEPVGKSIPAVISLPIEIMEGERPAEAKEFEVERV